MISFFSSDSSVFLRSIVIDSFKSKGSEVAIQSAEDAGVVAADIKDLVALQIKMTIQGVDQHIHRGNKDIECLRGDGDCRVQFDFHDKIRAALKI
jgi:hypothetical protein